MASVHLTKDRGGLFRVRVMPPDAAPPCPVVAETHVGYLSACTALATAGKVLGLAVVDETKGASRGEA